MGPWAEVLRSRVDGSTDELVLMLTVIAAATLSAFAATARRWLALCPLLAGVAATVLSGRDLQDLGAIRPHVNEQLASVGWGLYLTVLGAASLSVASSLLLVQVTGIGAGVRRRLAGRPVVRSTFAGEQSAFVATRPRTSGRDVWRRVRKLERAGELEAALAEARAFAAREPTNPYAHLALGELMLRSGDPAGSVSAFREAGRTAPRVGRWKIVPKVARGLSAAGRDREALELLRTFEGEMAPGPLGVERALLRRRLGDLEEAIDELEAVLAKNPLYRPAWHELADALDSLGRSDEAAAARRRLDALPRKHSAADVVEAISTAFPGEAGTYVVNLGCRDGKTKDPCYELFTKGYPGLAVDAGDSPRLRRRLHRNLPQPEVRKLLGTPLTPVNVVEVLRRAGCPHRPVLLKIDIDSFDGPLLAAALAGFDPDVIQIEVNPDFPPPLKFTIQYDPRYEHSGTAGFFGCSVAYVASICRPAGYELLQIDFTHPTRGQDATLVKQQYLSLFGVEPPVDERALFLSEPFGGWRGLVEIGVDTEAWREQTDFDALLSQAWDACVAASAYRSEAVLPFILSL
jgi:tetratricopeptide (TPR) repeat protein